MRAGTAAIGSILSDPSWLDYLRALGVGAVVVLVVLFGWMIHGRIREHAKAHGSRIPQLIGGGVIVVLAGSGLLAWAFSSAAPPRPEILGLIGSILVLAGAVTTGAALEARPDDILPARAGWIPIAAGVAFVAGVGVAALTAGAVSTFGILGAALGYTAFRFSIRTLMARRENRPSVRLVGLGAATAAAGGVSLLVLSVMWTSEAAPGDQPLPIWLTAVGAVGVGLGLATLGPCVGAARRRLPDEMASRLSWVLPTGASVALAGALIGAINLAGGSPLLVAVAAVTVIAVLAAALAARGGGIVLLIALVPIVVWVLQDRTTPRAGVESTESAERVLAVGDSYMSGEGAPDFVEGTNDESSDDPRCRRSRTAYPVLVAEELEMGLDFLACSGAVTVDDDERVDRDNDGQPDGHPNDIVAQLDAARELDRLDQTELVLISIGGNDASFGEIGQGCLYPGSCDELRSVWLNNMPDVRQRVVRSYQDVLRLFTEADLEPPPIVVVPYPRLLNEDGCGWSLIDTGEHGFLSEFVAALNAELEAAAQEAGVHYAADVIRAYGDRRVCARNGGPDTAAVNFIHLGPTEGSFSDRINPTNWIHGSLHPRVSGHELLAANLGPSVARLVEEGAGTNPEPSASSRPNARLTASTTVSAEPFSSESDGGPDDRCATVRKRDSDDTTPQAPTADAFATRVQVLDGRTPVRVSGVDTTAVICVTSGTGEWITTSPIPAAVAGRGGASIATVESEQPADPSAAGEMAEVLGAEVLFQPPPIPGDTAKLPTADGRRRGLPQGEHRQYVVYRDAPTGEWRQLIVDYCDSNDNCPSNVADWKNDQLAAAVRSSTLIILLAALGGLLGAGFVALRIWDREPGPRPSV